MPGDAGELRGLTSSQLDVLVRFVRQMAKGLEPAEVYSAIADSALALLDAERCGVFILDASMSSMVCKSSTGLSESFIAEACGPSNHNPVRAAALHGVICTVEDASVNGSALSALSTVQAEGFRGFTVHPIRFQNNCLGAITVHHDAPHRYTELERNLLGRFTVLAGSALENVRIKAENTALRFECSRLSERLKTLGDAALALSGVLDLDAIGDVVAQQAARVVRMNCFYIALYNAERERLTYTFYEEGEVQERNIEAGLGAGPSSWVVRHKMPHLTRSSDDPVHQSGEDWGEGPEPQSGCHVPMMLGNRIVGVISAQSYTAGTYTEEDVQILQTLAGQAAVAVENARLYRAVQEASLTDELTGLPNRRATARRIEDELGRAARYGFSLCVLMLDLDFFKAVNDSRGHPVGDELLREISILLRASLRSHDTLGRWGGEEFVVLLVHTDLEGGRKVAENLRRGVEQHSFLRGSLEHPLTISIGGCVVEPPLQSDLSSVISIADACLYMAKRTGRNRVVFTEQEAGAR